MISIIIPALNEAKALPATLMGILKQSGEYEIIVADGGSTDDTVKIADSYSDIKFLTAPAGRASQMNAGAKIAQGDWLLFLHADTQLPDYGLEYLNKLEADHRIQAGGFLHRFSGNNLGLRIISWINNQRCQRTRVFYGDQAPFVRRNLFEQLNGYPEEPILEDVLFMEKLHRITKPVALSYFVVTDARRFIQHGIWRSFMRVFLILSCHKLGLPIPARKFFDLAR